MFITVNNPGDMSASATQTATSDTEFICKLCGESTIKKSYTLRDSCTFRAAECGGCGLFQEVYAWWRIPTLGVTDLFDHSMQDPVWFSPLECEAHQQKGAMFAGILAKLGGLAGAKVLDVGCGKGHFLAECMRLGAKAVAGQEFRACDIQFAQDHGIPDVRTASFEDKSAWPDREFDIVCSIDVLEHLHDVNAFLESCIRVTKPGGIMFHVCPGFDSISNRIGRRAASLAVSTTATTLCNLQSLADSLGGPHVSIMGKKQVRWIAERFGLTLLQNFYVGSYTYSDQHYASVVPILKPLPRGMGASIFSLARFIVKNKIVFIMQVDRRESRS
jgi:SAM-dependent methyltransferase